MAKQIMIAGILVLLFALTYAILSDNFVACPQTFYMNEPPQLFAEIKNTDKCLCQEYENDIHFATFYDALRKIPYYSAYKLTNYIKSRRKFRKSTDLSDNVQALPKDYIGIDDEHLSRGHLAPRSYFFKSKSTDVLTNIAPQYSLFNKWTWERLETALSKASKNHCDNKQLGVESYFITGVLPSDNKFFNGKINIPSYFWTAVCCDFSGVPNVIDKLKGWSFAYMVANVNSIKHIIEMFTIENFLKDWRIKYTYRKLFRDIPVNNKLVKNCLFDSEKANEIINEIKTKIPNDMFFLPNSVERGRSKSLS